MTFEEWFSQSGYKSGHEDFYRSIWQAAYRAGQEDMRKRAACACLFLVADRVDLIDAIGCAEAISELEIKVE